MADNKPTLHHLNNSQSQRILWLLEELQIPYNLVSHLRNPPSHPAAFLSPDTLKAVGPYGKAPVLFTSSNHYIPESSAITNYLIRTFDTFDQFGLQNGDWIRDEILLSICQTGLQRATSTMIMLDFGMLRTGNPALGARANHFDGPELRSILKDLERELAEGPKGGFFMGEKPGRADIMLEFPISMVKQRNWVDLAKEFPGLDGWLERVYARPAWKRGIEKGNGYDLSVFPKSGREQKI